jgi:hypothetical protein
VLDDRRQSIHEMLAKIDATELDTATDVDGWTPRSGRLTAS